MRESKGIYMKGIVSENRELVTLDPSPTLYEETVGQPLATPVISIPVCHDACPS